MAVGTKKRPKVPHRIRAVVADNVARLMARQFPQNDKPRALATAAGVSLSTVQRMLDGTMNGTGSSIDTLGHVADVFHVQVYQLFVPMLDINAPQVVKPGSRKPKGPDGPRDSRH